MQNQEQEAIVISIEEVAGGNYVAYVEVEEGWLFSTPSSDPEEATAKGKAIADDYFSED